MKTSQDDLPLVAINHIDPRPNLVEAFEPSKILPVKVTEKGMELVEKFSLSKRSESGLILSVGTGRCNTYQPNLDACDSICVSLVGKAIRSDCEHILFFV